MRWNKFTIWRSNSCITASDFPNSTDQLDELARTIHRSSVSSLSSLQTEKKSKIMPKIIFRRFGTGITGPLWVPRNLQKITADKKPKWPCVRNCALPYTMLNFVVIILRKLGVTISFELAKKYIFIHIRMQDMFSINFPRSFDHHCRYKRDFRFS